VTRHSTRATDERGFTISEATLVVVLLVVLLTVVLTSLHDLNQTGNRIDCSDERRRLAVAAESYRAQHGKYPVDVTTLEAANMLKVGAITHVRIVSSDDTAVQIAPIGSACS
jgi:competence protein ComGC